MENKNITITGWNSPLPSQPALTGIASVGFKRLVEDAVIPEYKNHSDSGMDLRSIAFYNIPAGEIKMIQTGLALQLKDGLEAQVRPRSGLAAKYGVTVLNSPGTIDAGYRGEIKVILINHGKEDFKISKGDRIAQIVFADVVHPAVYTVDALDKTTRGEGGFGSTGIK